MANFYILAYFFTILSVGLSTALAEEKNVINKKREARHLLKSKLCLVLGNCGGYQGGYDQGYNQGGYNQGGYNQGGYNQGGYNQGGYNQGGYPYPPVNIGISQSQSSSSAGGGGYGISSYPNNYQYNGGHRYQGGYNGHRPGYFDNGFGSSNNQYNGILYGGPDGYGFRRPSDYYDGYSNEEDYDEDYSRSAKSRD